VQSFKSPLRFFTVLGSLFASALLFTGCQSNSQFTAAGKQTVSITSYPSDAEVIIDGRVAGRTPLILDLETALPHIVTVQRQNFQTGNGTFNPSRRPEDLPFLRFGWIDYESQTTYLYPENLHFNLRTTLIPAQRSGSYNELQAILDGIDQRLANGSISDEDHRAISLQIIDSFAN
jgi:hypothetical protein